MSEQKRVLAVYGAASSHWVGDRFPVRTIFPTYGVSHLSPFLMLDYAGPAHLNPQTGHVASNSIHIEGSRR